MSEQIRIAGGMIYTVSTKNIQHAGFCSIIALKHMKKIPTNSFLFAVLSLTVSLASVIESTPVAASTLGSVSQYEREPISIAKSNDDNEDDDDDDEEEENLRKRQEKTEKGTFTNDQPVATAHQLTKPPTALPGSFYVDSTYNRKILNSVDEAVKKRFYDPVVANSVWKQALEEQQGAILKSKTLAELGASMSVAFAALHSSHCNFVTVNDEMYHFLHALFSDFNKKLNKGKVDYVGFVTGIPPFGGKQVRYVLDGSPAARAGLQIGDHVLKVNGIDYVGYSNFFGTAGSSSTITIRRNDTTKDISIKPEKRDLYSAYVNATRKSVRLEKIDGKTIGYVHVWCGGRRSYEALDEILEEKLRDTDGLILDLRDGYGGNSLSDLDRFYRTPKAYPDFVTVDRNGKENISRYYYDKPIVALINDGSRSGKELISFSLKRTGRAKLVGTKTAGAVLAGSITPLDEKCTAYIAVLDGTIGGVRLEGVGVSPDIEIENKTNDQAGYNMQLATAREVLMNMLKTQVPGE
jgi:carboxyl-terminal processing protease